MPLQRAAVAIPPLAALLGGAQPDATAPAGLPAGADWASDQPSDTQFDTDVAALTSAAPAGCRSVKRAQTLYRSGDAFHSVYAVVSGCLKVVLFHSEGREQICGFPSAGDLLGLDGIHAGYHTSDVIALEDSQVRVIPFGALEARCRQTAAVQHHILRLMSAEIVREQHFFMLLGGMSAEERLAAFLVSNSAKLAARGYSPHEFHLRMTRQDIGNHLGMKLETVSRTFSKFQVRGLITVNQKHVTLRDLPALQALATL